MDLRSLSPWVAIGACALLGVLGCSKSSSPDAAAAGTTSNAGSPSATGGSSAGSSPGFPDAGGPVVVGPADDSLETKLPRVPALTNVAAVLNDDSTTITFDPIDGALDYRVYPLPSDSDIDVSGDGRVVVKNATYRCSGDRESAPPYLDDQPPIGGDAIHTQVDNQMVGGYMRTLAEATIGYVYTSPGPGRVPVYSLGESNPSADVTCFFARWAASRVKKYTTSENERADLLAAQARDDGIAFYIPDTASNATRQIYIAEDQPGTPYLLRWYFSEGPEADSHTNKAPAFLVAATQLPDTQPLMRVYYNNLCGWSHDELAVGKERFNRAYKQGDTLPWWSLLWTGISGPTTLVVEALDRGCPFQGHLSPSSLPSMTAFIGDFRLVHQPYLTIADARAASPTTEVFINGQHGPAWIWDGNTLSNGMQPAAPTAPPLPKAIARSFVKVTPHPHPKMDFFTDFKGAAEVFTDTPCGSPDGNCYATWRQKSATFDQIFMNVESDAQTKAPLFAFGQVMGENWVTYADVGADTNGKYRLTANQKATMSPSAFLHVTMEVDAYSTLRRYPQIIISDREAPIQYTLDKGHTLIIQPISETSTSIDWPIDYQIQVCNLRTWDVNNQCPAYDLHHISTPKGAEGQLAPNEEVGEHASVDHRVLFDVFASTKRVYVYLDGTPYACADMPAVGVPSGPVAVTWGDVLYHSSVDHTYAFHAAHMQIETRRHFDNLGFSSGLAAPEWDESRLPCVKPITL